MPVNLPTNLLRSFVAIVDTGSMLNASEKVFVTQSALSLQIKRLEELLQQNLFHREGRRLSLTQAGELMLDYARKVLILHDEAVSAITAGHFSGPARIGMVQDFAETLLSGLLAQFAELHPDAQIYSRIAGTAELLAQLERRQLDIVLGFAAANDPNAIAYAAMEWYGKADLLRQNVLPLAVLEPPCRFREAAIRTLEDAGVPYRITVETPNLTTLRAAVDAGLGITCRTHLFLSEEPLQIEHLAPLPRVSCVLQTAASLDPATARLAQLAREIVVAL
ncbi:MULTISPECIES: LysR substrate-binding domain-containing protein [unclassified Novosphingobium]|uniref:LysR substrate-binding domain-containing protein n=1 Tax=unclassified Novosphingobium TaxID=2644732 RepID=UPI000868C244|nr:MULTISPECIES: LysR substrate-binding domain-containing protein [unclassified Novosphingobium]MDR6708699.1 DNA-binding transcriptional LysR family regulator [Novosphingobium sp. 1748]ODU81954.1 MAG: LysR family transcriptional regulator [Novosphingobium sp. SCN 63-17]OJX96678.1 MAG: LysR family transcriptional regulator [Novosphingobium sp. 63-713]